MAVVIAIGVLTLVSQDGETHWMEGVLLLASIARNWKFSVVPETHVELLPVITLRPKFGMKLRADKTN